MKKFLFAFIAIGCFCLTGCGSNEEKVMTCKRTANLSGISMDLSYNISYSKSDVTRVQTVEKVTSSDSSVLNNYKSQIENVYEPYKDINYYNYNVSIDGNTLVSTTDIDYSKIDTDKLIEVDSANSVLIKNGKIDIDTIKSYYESLGISCEK